MLCAMCLSIFSHPLTESNERSCKHARGQHHECFEHVEQAAGSGCKICLVLQQQYSKHVRSEDTTNLHFQYELSLEGETAELVVSTSAVSQDCRVIFCITRLSGVQPPANHENLVQLATVDLPKEPWRVRNDGFLQAFSKTTGHRNVAKQGSAWLRNCLATHPGCEASDPNRGPMRYPKRLLDLCHRKPRLILTAHEPPKGEYATLSHCWGKAPFTRLSATNEDDFRQRLPIMQLPRSFRDAIIFARRLGIRYLWIDSLCILQDGRGHEEDWAEHASVMRNIYQNCTLNISILHAPNPFVGAFSERCTDKLQPCIVLWAPDGLERELWAVLYRYLDDLHNEIAYSKLSKRGWVIQERMFSPRTIHFGHQQVFWECREKSLITETHPSGLDSKNVPRNSHMLNELFPFKIHLPSKGSKAEIVNVYSKHQISSGLEAWHRLIYNYSGAELSMPHKDKLVAIEGIAQRFGVLYNEEYCAGLFRCHLPQDLLWDSNPWCRPIKHRPGSVDESMYRAPTWSWASVNGNVWFPNRTTPQDALELVEQVTVEDILIHHADGHTLYGRLEYAEIRLRGILRHCLLERVHGKSSEWRFTCVGALESRQNFNRSHNLRQTPKRRKLTSPVVVDVKLDNENWPLDSQYMMALPIIHGAGNKEMPWGPTGASGLILQPAMELGTYRRVGWFCNATGKNITEGYSPELVTII